jgi:hypothetical protein
MALYPCCCSVAGGSGGTTSMTHKSIRIAKKVAAFQGRGLDARYVGFFECFNNQLFYEAHEVLEDLWLLDRNGPDGDFYKGLIQLAGAFVHLQKDRLGPCVALLRLARTNFARYPDRHHRLDLSAVVQLTEAWEARVTAAQLEGERSREWTYPRLSIGR